MELEKRKEPDPRVYIEWHGYEGVIRDKKTNKIIADVWDQPTEIADKIEKFYKNQNPQP